MASKPKSRWADSEEDTAAAKRHKAEKKRIKAEKAARAEAERQSQAQQAAARKQQDTLEPDGDGPPAKRRRITPEPSRDDQGSIGASQSKSKDRDGTTGSGLLRLGDGGGFRRCRDVENYDKLNDIEEGAYGWVARARDRASGDVVALKRLKIDHRDRGGLPVTGLREMQILRDCSHRNIVDMREVVVSGAEETGAIENIFLVLEFVEHDLKSILEDMPEPFLASEIKTLLHQLASGLAYLHDNWILHRDIKTSNLLLDNRGRLRIADFGMARYAGDPPPQLTQLVVTLWYRAPELLLGTAEYGRAVDMWSVGCVFGELLTREPLLQGKNEADELALIFALCGVPTEESWPGFRRLPNARGLKLPPPGKAGSAIIRAKFPLLTGAGSALLAGLLALDPEGRPSAREMLEHEYFRQDPRMKREDMFPTFPSKAGQERRRRRETPNAPHRGQAVDLGAVDFTGIFSGREREERGGGFSLRMV